MKRYSEKIYKSFITAGYTFWKKSRKGRIKKWRHQAFKFWGKAGYVKRKMKEIREKVITKLQEPPKPLITKKNAYYRFWLTLEYKGKKKRKHDFEIDLYGNAVLSNNENEARNQLKRLILDEISADDYLFWAVVGDVVRLNLEKEEETDEDIGMIRWEERSLKRF